MLIRRLERTFIPDTKEGRAFADEYEKRLKDRGCFVGRTGAIEVRPSIIITALYEFNAKDDEDAANDDL